MHRACSAFLALALLACEPPSDTVETSAPIVGGTRELGEPAVVTIETFGGLCSGTLIANDVVLTAKHCVQAPGADAPYSPSVFSVGVGDSTRTATPHRVRYVDTTPGRFDQDPLLGLRGAIFGVDIGVLILREPVPDVTPIPIRRDRPDDLVGGEFTAIGFGQRPDGGAGLKYKGTGTLDSIDDAGILYSHQIICSGDSGGPMIQEGPERRIVGVASFGQADSCPSVRDGYNAIFSQLDIIDRAMTIAGHCVARGEEVCNSVDDDCNGEIDEGCAAPGEACTADTDCAFAQLPGFLPPIDNPVRCEDLGEGPVCTRPCDPLAPAQGCSEFANFGQETPTSIDGLYCRRTTGCEGRCALGSAGDGVDGSECTRDSDCASLACVDPSDGRRRCLPTCRAGDGTCPVGEACVAAFGECGVCVSASELMAARQLGEPCEGDGQCAQGGSCVTDPGGAYCTHTCAESDECPAGFHCGASMTCERGALAATGEPCIEASDCGPGDFCVGQGDRHWCTRVCDASGSCPDGLECVEAGGAQVCAPAAALLGEACGADGDCAGGVCDEGVCTRACGATTACPVGFGCRRDDAGRARCLAPPAPPSSGGCSVGRGEPALGLGLFGFAALAIALRRRARR